MNYESHAMSRDEMVEATYNVAIGLNRVKARAGATAADVAERTERRTVDAMVAMRAIDRIMEGPAVARDPAIAALKAEMDRLSESTVCEKSDLNWPRILGVHTIGNIAKLWARETAASLAAASPLGERR